MFPWWLLRLSIWSWLIEKMEWLIFLLLNYKVLVHCGWKSPALPVSNSAATSLTLGCLSILFVSFEAHFKLLLFLFLVWISLWESLSKSGTMVTLIARQILCPFFFAHGMKQGSNWVLWMVATCHIYGKDVSFFNDLSWYCFESQSTTCVPPLLDLQGTCAKTSVLITISAVARLEMKTLALLYSCFSRLILLFGMLCYAMCIWKQRVTVCRERSWYPIGTVSSVDQLLEHCYLSSDFSLPIHKIRVFSICLDLTKLENILWFS